jgi:hypothetical protein
MLAVGLFCISGFRNHPLNADGARRQAPNTPSLAHLHQLLARVVGALRFKRWLARAVAQDQIVRTRLCEEAAAHGKPAGSGERLKDHIPTRLDGESERIAEVVLPFLEENRDKAAVSTTL